MMVTVMYENDDENYQVPCKFLMMFSLRARSSISGVWTHGMVTETLTCVAQEDCSSKAWSGLVPKRVCVVNVMRAEPVPSVGSVLLLLSALKKTPADTCLHLHRQGHVCHVFVFVST